MEASSEESRAKEHRIHSFNEIAWQSLEEGKPATLDYLMRDYVGHLKSHLVQILGKIDSKIPPEGGTTYLRLPSDSVAAAAHIGSRFDHAALWIEGHDGRSGTGFKCRPQIHFVAAFLQLFNHCRVDPVFDA